MASNHQRLTCRFSGRVQGVGFRYTAMNIAQEYAVQGCVRNTSDGGVELVIEGAASETEAMVEELKQRMEAYIDHADVTRSAATGEYKRFAIQH
jgi:acylphosphatase